MEHGSLTSNSNIIKRSFYQERQDRVNYDPYLPRDRVSRQKSAPASERFLNFVKGKVHEAVATFKKLLDGTPESSSPQTIPVSNHYNLPQIPNDRLNNLSSLIQETISKPEYQQHYNINANKDPSKASFLNLMNFYKDVSAEKIREKMEESHSLIIPEPVKCPYKPVAHYGNQIAAKKAAVAPKQRSRKGSQASSASKTANLNAKRELHSILSSKEKKLKERKKVHFKPEHQRSFSSMIKYTSSDEEDDELEEPINKTILSEISDVRKDPALKLSMISSRRAKINPFQRKSLVEKTSISQLLRSEKLAKKPYMGDFYRKQNGDKFLPGDSFVSDNFMNDSKIETDSDESNSNSSVGKDIIKSGKVTEKKYADLSDESEKGSPKFNEPSPKKYSEPNRLKFPSIIEEQDAEKEESSFGDQQQDTTIEMTEKPQETKSLFGNQNNVLSPVFKQESPKLQLKASSSGELKLPSAKNSPEEKPQASPLFNLNNSPPKDTLMSTGGIINPPAIERLPSQEQPQIQASVVEPPKPNYEEALKNPLFASLNLKKVESVEESNPFLNPGASKTVNISSLFPSSQQVESVKAPEQIAPVQAVAAENTFLNNNNNLLAAPAKPRGILDLVQSAQGSSTPEPSGSLFNNTLKPVASYSWLNQNQSTEEVKAPNLFGNFGATPIQPILNAQPQGNLFGQLFSGGNTAGGMSMNNENVNSMMSESGNSSLFNNNTNLFGGAGAFVNNNNSGSLFGGNTAGGMGALNQPDSMNSNPFLFNSGVGGGFNSNANPVGGFSAMGNNSFTIDSGKKKKNQRERAF